MQQLIMRWKNDGTPAQKLSFPEGFEMRTLPQMENGIDKWLDIVQYGLAEKREDVAYYRANMSDLPNYEEEKCYFILENGNAVATVNVICNPETKEGLINMVGCVPECRGKGVGNMLGSIAVHVLKTAGMETASLRTDDFRVPAIKTYLRAGFQPDLSTEDYVQRWDAIYQKIGKK